MYLDQIYFVGFTSEAAGIGTLPEIHAPSNYKDKDKIAHYIAEAEAKRRLELHTCPGLSSITAVAVHDWWGKLAFSAIKEEREPLWGPSVKFWEWYRQLNQFSNRYGHTSFIQPGEHSLDVSVPSPVLFGIRIKLFMHIAAIDTLSRNKQIKVPVQVWRDGLGICDPYEALFNADTRKVVDLNVAAQLLLDEYVREDLFFQRPSVQAKLAHGLTVKGQLLGTDPEEFIGFSSEYHERQAAAKAGSVCEAGATGGQSSVRPPEIVPWYPDPSSRRV